jgi:hypothetical protein
MLNALFIAGSAPEMHSHGRLIPVSSNEPFLGNIRGMKYRDFMPRLFSSPLATSPANDYVARLGAS